MEAQRRLSKGSDTFQDAQYGEPIDASQSSSLSPEDDKAIKEFLLFLVKKFCMKTPVFMSVKSDEEILEIFKELETWNPPEYLRKNFPMYYTGRTDDGRPIWILETGKCDLNALLKQGPEVLGAMDKSIIYTLQIIVKSMYIRGAKPEFKRCQGFADLEGMHFGKINSPAAIAMMFTYTQRYKAMEKLIFEKGFLINSNYVVEFVVNKLRPLARKILKRVQIYGKDESIWKPILQKSFPKTALPEFYGGSLQDTAYAHDYIDLYLNFTFDSPMLKKDFIIV